MKELFKSLGKALVYFLVYFMTQIVVSMIWGMVMSISFTAKMMADDPELDMALLTEQLTEAIMSQAMLMTFVSGVVALLILWIVFLIRKKNFFTETDIKSIPVAGILPITLLGISFNIIVSVAISYIPFPQSWMDSYAENAAVIGEGSMVVAWIATVIGAPIVEEVIFRGLMYSRLKKGMPRIAAAIIVSLAFALVHGTMIWGIYTFCFSILLIWIYEKYQSLTANILLHVAFNFAGMVLGYVATESTVVVVTMFIVALALYAGATIWSTKVIKNVEKS